MRGKGKPYPGKREKGKSRTIDFYRELTRHTHRAHARMQASMHVGVCMRVCMYACACACMSVSTVCCTVVLQQCDRALPLLNQSVLNQAISTTKFIQLVSVSLSTNYNNDRLRSDGLNSKNVNKYHGGTQATMRNTTFSNNTYLGPYDHNSKLQIGMNQFMLFCLKKEREERMI